MDSPMRLGARPGCSRSKQVFTPVHPGMGSLCVFQPTLIMAFMFTHSLRPTHLGSEAEEASGGVAFSSLILSPQMHRLRLRALAWLAGLVTLQSTIGSTRVLHMLSGDELPRIC